MTQSVSGLPVFKSNFHTLELIYFGDIPWPCDCSVLVVDLGVWGGGVLLFLASAMVQAIAITSSYSSAKVESVIKLVYKQVILNKYIPQKHFKIYANILNYFKVCNKIGI